MDIVNLERFPIHKEGNPEHQRLLQLSSIKQLQQRGFVSLPNFLRTDAINELTSSILELERRGVGFHSNDTHNVFLEENADNSSASPSSMHPRHIQLESSKLILNARDIAPYATGLENLFTSEDFHRFISSVLNTQLHPSADPYGKYYANVFREGDGLNWHFDRSEYSISLVLQPADEGGEFQFVPSSRDIVEGWDEMPLNMEDVSRALRPHSKVVESPKLAAGDVYIFQGHNALHRVSKIAKGTRINVIFTFGTEADMRLNAYTLRKFFGIVEDSPES
ncbi:hypothetical protein ACHAXT_009769 [Thalassiosira profunda]